MRLTQVEYLDIIGLHPAQRQVWQALKEHRRVALAAGRRFGKSTLMAAWLLWNVLRQKQCWAVAPSHELARSLFDLVVSLSQRLPEAVRRRLRFRRSSPYEARFVSGWCCWYSSENPTQLQARGLDVVVCDESGDIRELDIILRQFITPATLDRNGQIVCVGTPRGRNDFYEYFSRDDVKSFQFASADNPHLSQEAIAAMAEEIGEELAEQELQGQFVEWSGRFFSVQPVVDDVSVERLWCGIDWGFSSPFAAVWLGIDGERYVVVHEVYAEQLDPDEQARLVLEGPRAVSYICDPSTPQHVVEAWRRVGLYARAGSRDRIGGLHLMRQLLRQQKLVVRSSCYNLLNEFQNAMVDARRGDDIDQSCADHALDALRYALLEMPAPQTEKPQLDPMQRFIQRSLRRSGVRV